MKLLIQNDKIVGTVADNYSGNDIALDPPEGFSIDNVDAYTVIAGEVVLRPLTVKDYDDALTNFIDSVAKQRNWADRVSCMSRAGFPNVWQSQAIAFGTWAASCEVLAYQIQQEVLDGIRPMPTISELLSLMPEMIWPT